MTTITGMRYHDTWIFIRPIGECKMPKDKNSPSFASATLSILPTVAFNTPMPIPMRPEQSITFIHIPQTGGSNLNYLVCAKAWVPPGTNPPFNAKRFALPTRKDKISPKKMIQGWEGGLYTVKNILPKTPNSCESLDFESLDFLQSHFPFGVHEYIKRKTAYVTLVRDPVSRELSALNAAHQRYDIGSNPTEYLMGCLDNPQTRLLAGQAYMEKDCTEETLVQAKKNINEHFLLAGVTEDTNGFLQIFASMQKWGPIALCKAQVTGKKVIDTPTPALKQMLEEKHQFDVQLYAWVRDRWYKWKQTFVQDEPQAIPRLQPIFSIVPDYPDKRMPQFMTKKEIQAFNQKAPDELVNVIQNPSGLSTITDGQAAKMLAILDSYIKIDNPQIVNPHETLAQLVLSYLYHPSEIVPRIEATPVSSSAPQVKTMTGAGMRVK